MTRQGSKGIEGLAAQFRSPAAVQQLPVKVQLHAVFQALLELAQGAAQVVPGITARCTGRQH
ncbi:hypothetical protein D3C76_1786180 [compost metagenome]